jgi:hypothetical protein
MEHKVFINHTHHNSSHWSEKQLAAAGHYGEIIDMEAPVIGAHWNTEDVVRIAGEYAARIIALAPAAVLCQGEFTYTYALVSLLERAEIPVVAACSERQTIESIDAEGNTERTSLFQFVRFRSYGV